jgi:hypothetical protein
MDRSALMYDRIAFLYGVVGYAAVVVLAILWLGIAVSFALRGRRRWVWLAAGLCGFALQYTLLVLLAGGQTLLGQERNAWLVRSACWLGVVGASGFTWRFLRSQWRHDQRQQEKGNYEPEPAQPA